jgi:hypothetical protein
MGTSIERVRPKLPKKRNGNSIALALSVFDQPGYIGPHLRLANRIWAMERRAELVGMPTDFRHAASGVGDASRVRSHWLPLFQAAAEADVALEEMHGSQSEGTSRPVQRSQAIDMLSVLLRAFGAKNNDAALFAMVDMFASAGDVAAGRMERPLYVSAVSLALACRELIANKERFAPQPAEVAEACREADRHIRFAQIRCEQVVNRVRRSDAVLLEFAPEQWCEPYLTPQYRPMVQRMLELHWDKGNSDDEFDPGLEWVDESEEKTHNQTFRLALQRAREQFPALPKVEPAEHAKPRIAACNTTPAKRTHKPKERA